MSKSKKIFILFAVVFVFLIGYASYDIATRTTFPGSRPQLKDRIKRNFIRTDTAQMDSVKNIK